MVWYSFRLGVHCRPFPLGIFTFGNPFEVCARLLGFFCESDDLTVRLQSLFAICSEIPVQFIAFLNKLFQLDIHPVDLSFVDSFDGDGLSLGAF